MKAKPHISFKWQFWILTCQIDGDCLRCVVQYSGKLENGCPGGVRFLLGVRIKNYRPKAPAAARSV